MPPGFQSKTRCWCETSTCLCPRKSAGATRLAWDASSPLKLRQAILQTEHSTSVSNLDLRSPSVRQVRPICTPFFRGYSQRLGHRRQPASSVLPGCIDQRLLWSPLKTVSARCHRSQRRTQPSQRRIQPSQVDLFSIPANFCMGWLQVALRSHILAPFVFASQPSLVVLSGVVMLVDKVVAFVDDSRQTRRPITRSKPPSETILNKSLPRLRCLVPRK